MKRIRHHTVVTQSGRRYLRWLLWFDHERHNSPFIQCKSIPKQYYHELWPPLPIPGDSDNAMQTTNPKACNNGYAVVRCRDRWSLADIRIRNNAILSRHCSMCYVAHLIDVRLSDLDMHSLIWQYNSVWPWIMLDLSGLGFNAKLWAVSTFAVVSITSLSTQYILPRHKHLREHQSEIPDKVGGALVAHLSHLLTHHPSVRI